jgi:hypothetical protein
MWASAAANFRSRYQQWYDCAENTRLFKRFLEANRDHTGLGIQPCAENVEIFFKTCFSRLWLRFVIKVEDVDESAAPAGFRQQLSPGQGYAPFLFDKANAAAQARAKAMADAKKQFGSTFPTPVKMKLVETILSPTEVRQLSADDTAKFMQPMQFPSVTSSANDYLKSDEFLADSPAYLTRAQREQTQAQINREVKLFAAAYPSYGKYLGQPEKYSGLYEKVLAAIDSWGMLINASSLLDGFNFAASEGWIPKLDDRADGQVSVFHTTPDANPHHTKTSVGQIRYHGKLLKDMTSQELQTALNSDSTFRALVDAAV